MRKVVCLREDWSLKGSVGREGKLPCEAETEWKLGVEWAEGVKEGEDHSPTAHVCKCPLSQAPLLSHYAVAHLCVFDHFPHVTDRGQR